MMTAEARRRGELWAARVIYRGDQGCLRYAQAVMPRLHQAMWSEMSLTLGRRTESGGI